MTETDPGEATDLPETPTYAGPPPAESEAYTPAPPAEDPNPERAVLAAFAGGLVFAQILKRLGS